MHVGGVDAEHYDPVIAVDVGEDRSAALQCADKTTPRKLWPVPDAKPRRTQHIDDAPNGGPSVGVSLQPLLQ